MLEAAWSSTFDLSPGTPGTALVHGVVNNRSALCSELCLKLYTFGLRQSMSLLKRNISQRQFQL